MSAPGSRKKSQSIKPDKTVRNGFPIVGVGASAGGLKAFQQLLEHLPAEPGMAFVLIPHLAPSHESMMSAILQKSSKMPIQEVTEGVAVRPNHVYIIPPNTTLSLSEGKLHAARPGPSGPYRESIDHFLLSLAGDARGRAIGIVLSGTASDGAIGIKAIKSEGGITFAQDASAEFSGMPQAAVATGSIDFVLPPKAIAQELVRIAQHPYLVASPDGAPEKAVVPPEMENELGKILHLLQAQTGVPFAGYKPNTVRRRIGRRMAICRLEHLEDYRKHLEADRKEIQTLHDDILINVTSFFRDPESFQALKDTVFPKLLENRPSNSPIRLWVAGCATGEEAYSLAIALLEFLEEKESRIGAQIFASDVDEGALLKARAGIYDGSIDQEVFKERLRRFFTPVEGGRYQIAKRVRDLCLFAKHDLTGDPPFSKVDLLSCRNVLIYFGPVLQKRLIPLLHYALKPTGFLMLGSSETADRYGDLFKPVDRKHKIYSKIQSASHSQAFDFHSDRAQLLEARGGVWPQEPAPPAFDLAREVDRLLVREFVPAGVVVSGEGQVVELRGDTRPFLHPAPGKPTLTLHKMVEPELIPEVESAIREAKEKGTPVRRESVRFGSRDGLRTVTIHVRQIQGPTSRDQYYVVIFQVSPIPGTAKEKPQGASKAAQPSDLAREVERLNHALETSREYQQTVLEKVETSNEELRSSHEEVLSANEELQSSNEELETAKEELQSANEELKTLNDELQQRNEELGQSNSDLTNVLASVQIPIAIIDSRLRLRRVTPAGEKLLNVISSDVNRRITDFKPNINVENLEEFITHAIDKLTSVEQDVQDREGRWYSLRIRPYRSVDNKIEGAILTIVDIDAVKRFALENERARAFSEAVIDAVPYALLVLNGFLQVERANEAFFSLFRVNREETEKRLFYEIGDGQWNIPELRALLEKILPASTRLEDFEVDHDFPRVGRKTLHLHARKLTFWHTHEPMIVLAIEDVSERHSAEREVRSLASTLEGRVQTRTAELAEAFKHLDAFTYTVSHDLRAPLRAMNSYNQILIEDYAGKVFDETAQDYARRVAEAARRMDRLVQDLLEYSRLSRAEITVERVDLEALVSEVLKGMEHEISEKKVEVTADGPFPAVFGHRSTLEQVLTNLMSNAAKFVPPGARPRIHVWEEIRGGWVRVWVEDNGIGIPREHQDRIFNVFERLHKQEEYPGTGIGLAIAKKAMERMGGRIGLESEVGKGSRFWIELPKG